MPEVSEILRFIIQISAALAGAACLWGFILFWRSKKSTGKEREGFYNLAYLLSFLYLSSLAVFLVSWWSTALIFFPPAAVAHEGIVIKPALDYIQKGFEVNVWLVSLLLLVSLAFFVLFSVYRRLFRKYGGWLFLIQFLILSAIISTTVFTGRLDGDKGFFILHNWHSILTLGTVLTVDFLYVMTLRRDDLKRVLYPFFPFLSIAIWVGLGIDFLSVALIFEKAFEVTTQFFFNQTVIAILIINGALLSGKISNLLKDLVSSSRVGKMSPKMNILFGISGSVSIISWFTITALDFFRPDFSYAEFWVMYLGLIAIAFISQHFLKKFILSRPVLVEESVSGYPVN